MIAGALDGPLRFNLSDLRRLATATLQALSRAGREVAVYEPERVRSVIREFAKHGTGAASSGDEG